MEIHILGVVLMAAFLHAFWNFLVRRNQDKALAMAAVIIGHGPLAFLALIFYGFPPFAVWPYLLAGALFHTGYQIFLLNAYRHGGLSQVYPVARGTAPLLVTLGAALWIGELPSRWQLAGIILVCSGLVINGLANFLTEKNNIKTLTLAVITGSFIAAYSVTDGVGARLSENAIGYYATLSILNLVIFPLYLIPRHPGVMRKLFKEGLPIFAIGGSLSFIAYALILWACLFAPLAVVSSLRETSILFAVLLGKIFLKEKLTLLHYLFIALIIAGILAIRLSG